MATTVPQPAASGLHFLLPPGRKPTAIDLIGGILCQICNSVLGNKKDFDSHYLNHDTGTEEITYTCVACHLTSTSYPSFRGHCYSSHVSKDRYRCSYCKKTFSKPSHAKDHIKNVHNFKCDKSGCNKRFPSKKELHVHQILHKSEANQPPYQCQTCGEEFENIPSCEDHIDKHYTVTYSCPLCDDNLNKENAYKHLMNHFGVVIADIPSGTAIEETPEDSSINIVGGILCCYCDTLFKNRIEIDIHFADKHPDKDVLYTCVICHKPFEKYSLYGDHCYNHCVKHRYVCDVCDKTFSRLFQLVIHAEVHKADIKPYSQNDPEFRCRLCKLLLSDALAAHRHLSAHRQSRFACPVCAREYAEKYKLIKHVPQHFEAVFHMCKSCGKTFATKNRLIEHVKTHSSVKSLECKYCGKGFLKPYQLSQHVNLHTGARPYACVSCPKTFVSYPNWMKHVRRMHNIDPKLSQHVNVHTEARPYACASCPKAFAAYPNLRKHVRRMHNVDLKISQHVNVHTRARPYACVSCAKTFTTYPNLKVHIRRMHDIDSKLAHVNVHTGTRPYACVTCPKTFAAFPNLKKHVRRMHNIDPKTLDKTQFDVEPNENRTTDEKSESKPEPFEAKEETIDFCDDVMEPVPINSTHSSLECKYCGKGFLSLDQLSQHVNEHTEARPYTCASCPKTFTAYKNLNKHVRRMHNIDSKLSQHEGTRPYPCVSCVKTFTTYPNLKKHVRRMHDIDPKTLNKTECDVEFNENRTTDDKSESKPEPLKAKEETFDFCDDLMEPVSINSTIVEREAMTYEFELKSMDTSDESIAELTPILPDDIDRFISEMLGEIPENIPHEYGPDFGPDDAPLVHVAPQLVTGPPAGVPPPSWESPVITKVCTGYYGDLDLSFIDTDIF